MERHSEIKVRGYHTDFYGHVNNARYLEFFEEGRWALLESQVDLRKWVAKGLTFMVVNINVNYKRAVGVGETLVVSARLQEIGSRSAVLSQLITLKGSEVVAADALVTFVVIGKEGRALAMEGDLRSEIEKLQHH